MVLTSFSSRGFFYSSWGWKINLDLKGGLRDRVGDLCCSDTGGDDISG
jgi:hypothetical protein